MKVTVKYAAQLKRAAGTASEDLNLPESTTAQGSLWSVAQSRPDLQRMLFAEDGSLLPTILVFVGEEQIDQPEQTTLKDGDVVTLLSPIAGG